MSDNENIEIDEARLLEELNKIVGNTDPISFTDAEIEQHRQEDLDNLLENRDTSVTELVRRYINEVGIHEALHAGWMVSEIVSTHLCEHPAIVMDPVAYRHAFNAHTALFNLYQRLGALQHAVVTDEEQEKQ